ncbi:hypothetical protein PVAP13_6KG194906 [Panicum virgatum]|uniref:At1g61320/AtMIF1 LRR domain-containing protein n=1 Tax=Panicum virgatum TaxID=38727 RepID=A0A8T0REK0_PANVG|nr:hypothetical protein PVAP13_6KG194906 [Panicum virgatum]
MTEYNLRIKPARLRLHVHVVDDHGHSCWVADGSIALANKPKGSPCQQDDGDSCFLKENGDGDSQAGETTMRCSIPCLPEDIWHHVHSLMSLRDAARAACLSHAFLRSWRCYPNLTFNWEALRHEACTYRGDFGDAVVDSIMRNHSGIGVKILKLGPSFIPYHNNLNRKKYKFPVSLLSDGVRNSLRYLELGSCTFHPTSELGPLQSPISSSIGAINIPLSRDDVKRAAVKPSAPGGPMATGAMCRCNDVSRCNGYMKIQCHRFNRRPKHWFNRWLEHPITFISFSYLKIFGCWRLKLIESKAPNLSTLNFFGKAKLSLGEALQMKTLSMSHSDVVCYARTELPSIMPNLGALTLSSCDEVVNTPMLPTKFLCLKHLTICLGSRHSPYDYFSLVSFLEASPSLETLSLDVWKKPMNHETVFGHSPHLRQMTEDQHCYLKNVKIMGFSSAKGLVELTCYILKNAVSLECLTLDTNYGCTSRCSDSESGRCGSFGNGLREARTALRAIRTYIEDKIPARVKLTVVGPCSQCHKLS